MAIRKLEKADWEGYFNRFSHQFMHTRRIDYAALEVLSPEVGAQPETAWLPLRGLTYEPRQDMLEIAVENLDHMIYHPTEIYVDEDSSGLLLRMEVVEADGTKELLELR
jgi:hypothetical protein